MQNTQLTVLIDFIDSELAKFESLNTDKEETFTVKAAKIVAEGIKRKAVKLLPKEREDMEKMYSNGYTDAENGHDNDRLLSSNNFTQYKPKEDGK